MPTHTVTLTNVAEWIWLDDFSLAPKDGPKLAGSSQWSIKKTTLRGGVSSGSRREGTRFATR